jgi:hypothetical protein
VISNERSLLSPTNSWWNPQESSGFPGIPGMNQNLRICVIPGSFLVHSWFAVSTSGMARNIPQESIRTDRSFLTIIILVRKIKCMSKN